MKISPLLPLTLLMAMAVGCSTVKTVSEDSAGSEEKNTDYTVVTYVHGDSDYLFHSENGQSIQGDKNALLKVRNSAQKAENGEYFIFHKKKKKKFLGIFPRRNSQLYHYRNGELVNLVSYRSESENEPFFETESKIFRDLSPEQRSASNRMIFLFFGHEIPLFPGDIYHRSLPGIEVHTESFADGVQTFIPGDVRFNLVALSTCNNGSPSMIHHLQDVSDIVLASPQNLHLSHLDTEQFSLLETDPDITSLQLAEAIAENTFNRLSNTVQTAVSLSVYDMENVSSYIKELHIQTDRFIDQENPNLYRDNTDCSKLPFFDSKQFKSGVTTLFRPAAFGRDAGDSEHSGWGCKGI